MPGREQSKRCNAESNYNELLDELLDHVIGRSRGGLTTKSHRLVDGHGLPLVTIFAAGQDGNSPLLGPLGLDSTLTASARVLPILARMPSWATKRTQRGLTGRSCRRVESGW